MKKFILFFILMLHPVLALADDGSSASYYVPPAQFNASMQIMSLGFANVMALFQNATGSFSFDDSTKSINHLRLAVDASSLMTGNVDNQRDLASLFDVRQYPEIRLTSSDTITFKDGKADIKANLTLHGTTKSVPFEATLNHVGNSPYGGGMFSSEGQAVGLSMRGSFKRADFGIGDNPDSDEKNRFGDSVTLQLEMQAIRQ